MAIKKEDLDHGAVRQEFYRSSPKINHDDVIVWPPLDEDGFPLFDPDERDRELEDDSS